MIESVYRLARTEEKTIEKVLMDENLHYLHMVLNRGEGLPEHDTNANVYMTVLRGILTIALGAQEAREYEAGTLLKIPFGTRMIVKNLHADTLELTVVKAPAPKS
jgi:quercetin dioxygenase-like cupin family protein